jgi:hypothetical protein
VIVWSDEQYAYVRRQAALWDSFNSQQFFGVGLYQIVKPLLDSFNPDYGVPKQIETPSESLPETTATVLLALHRMHLLRGDMRELIQEYLWSAHHAVAAGLTGGVERFPDAQCWSAGTRNVWTTAACLWALIGTGYSGSREALYPGAARWLANEQNDDGSWGFSRDLSNPPSVFLTAVCLYTLRLARAARADLGHDADESCQLAVSDGLEYLRRARNRSTGLWHLPSGELEPTSSVMALWALSSGGLDADRSVITSGVKSLSRRVGTKRCGATLEIATGTLPDSREAIALQGYTPALPLALLQMGVDPRHALITTPLNFLRTTRLPAGWDFPIIGSSQKGRYLKSVPYVGTGEPLTFTTALAMQTVHAWHRRMMRLMIIESLPS